MSSAGRRAVFALARWSGLPLLLRHTAQRRRLTVLAYHAVGPDVLDAHLTALGRRYTFVALRDWVDAHAAAQTGRMPDRALAVTLDDGLASQFGLLDVFQRHGVSPTIFVCSGIAGTDAAFWWLTVDDPDEVERLKRLPDAERRAQVDRRGRIAGGERRREALSAAEIDQLRAVVEFGSHTVSHPILTRCTDERARAEIVDSKAELMSRFRIDAQGFAYPNGDYAEREVAFVREAGYRYAVTTQTEYLSERSDPLALGRVVMGDEASVTEAIVQASGLSSRVRDALGL